MSDQETNDAHPVINHMVEREFAHLKTAAEIEKKIAQIEHSAKVDIPELAVWHNALRMKYAWYYRWHMSNSAHAFQYILLILYLIFWIWIIIHQ